MSLKDELSDLLNQGLADLKKINDQAALNDLRVSLLGKKKGQSPRCFVEWGL